MSAAEEGVGSSADQQDPLLAEGGQQAAQRRMVQMDWTVTLWVIPPIIACVLAPLPNIAFGYDIGAFGGTYDKLESSLDLDSTEMELNIGIFYVGAAFGGLFAGALIDGAGRRAGVVFAGLLLILGISMQASAHSLARFFAGRVFAGLGAGITWVSTAAYTAELAPQAVRGTLCSLVDFSINVGIFLGYLVSWALFEDGWRIVFVLVVAAPLVSLVLLPLMPESPRWLFLSAGNPTAAEMVLERTEATREDARERIKELAALATHRDNPTWLEMAANPKGRVALAFATTMGFLHQAMGTEAILYYSSTMLEAAGFTNELTIVKLQVVIATCKLAGTALPLLVSDRAGRRPLLQASAGLMAASMFTLAISYWSGFPDWVPVVMLTIVMLFYNLGVAPLSLVVVAEASDSRYRASAISVFIFINRLTAGAVAFSFLSLRDAWGGEGPVFFMYGMISTLAVVVYNQLVPELKGVALDSEDAHAPPMWRKLNGQE